ncbi:tetratricopeptide repeat protein [Paracoccus subflavus]|uniref:Tetratricopeptide repeat protein n=1 Tax=Paracoccus subflavus TaxID=2528244 RepID=A0A4Q9FZD8_9RHOB|nr:tetratricopeptide repeat protein [Paracoccus subflavus]TBN38666.1 tetratricopeptide repeat protein [Paracoccus subflavus]
MTFDVSFRADPVRRGKRLLLSTVLVAGLGLSLAGCKSTAEKADEYYQSGLQLLDQGDTDRAIVQFRNVFDLDGTHYEARKALAEVHRQRGETSQAYSQYLRLAEQYPDDLPVRIALARMAFDAQQGDEFERHATRAVEIAPQDIEVQVLDLTRQFRAATQAEDADERARLAEEAVRLAAERPDDPLLIGILLDRAASSGDLDEADRLTARLLELQPDNPQRYMQRLALLAERQDNPAIEAHLRATIEQFPENTQAKADLVRFYMSQGQPEKAEDFLRELAAAAPPDNPAPGADLVRFVELQRGVDAARAEVDRIIAEGGDPVLFRTLRAGYDFQAGKRNEAIAEIRAVLEGVTEPTDASRDVRVQLARMLVETGDAAGARQQVDEVLAENAGHPGALKLKSAWDIQTDRVDDAVLSLRAVLDQAPEDAEALSLMADAYERAGEPDLARDYLSQAAAASGNAPGETLRLVSRLAAEERWRPAEDALLPALRQAPDNLALLQALGQVYLGMPDMPRAEGVITRLREIGTPEASSAADRLELGRLASQEGEAAALAYLEQQATAAEADTGAKLGLIRAQLATGQTAAALTIARDMVAADPESRPARMALGLAQAANADLPAARDQFQALVAEQPDDPAPHLALIRLAAQEGDLPGALALNDQALAAAPDNPDLLWSKAGLVERMGDIDAAIAIYEQLYARDSASIIVANNLASLLATWKSEDPAAVARATAVARRLNDTTVPAFMDTYGWIQHLNGDSQAALPYLEGAAQGLPGDPIVQLHLGIVQAAVGKNDAARAQLQKGLDMLPEGQEGQSVTAAREVLARLENPAPADAAAPNPVPNPAPDDAAAVPDAEPAPDPAPAAEGTN